MTVHKKIMQARIALQQTKLQKSGHNKFAGYDYFELADFLPTVQEIFSRIGLCGIVSFTTDLATLTITDLEDNSSTQITSPMGSAALKGCHEVQNIGAVETYQRRYLWVAAMEICEHDALDAQTGKDQPRSAKTQPQADWDALDVEQQQELQHVIDGARAELNAKGPAAAVTLIKEQQLPPELHSAIWSQFSSRERAAMKGSR